MLCALCCRGRGALGLRMDEAGPFMEPPAGGGELENEDTAVLRRGPVGPAKPEWLQPAAEGEGGSRGGAAAPAEAADEAERRRARKEKKRARKEKKRLKKEERRRKKKRRRRRRSSGSESDSSDSSD